MSDKTDPVFDPVLHMMEESGVELTPENYLEAMHGENLKNIPEYDAGLDLPPQLTQRKPGLK